MKMNKRKKRCCLGLTMLIVLLCVCVMPVRSYAAEQTGSIHLTLQQSDKEGKTTAYSGIHMALYKVGDVSGTVGAFQFELSEEFENLGIDINQEKTASDWMDAAQSLAKALESSNLSFDEKESDVNGTINYSDLAEGVYLVKQSKDNDKVKVSPMILTVPFYNSGEWIYEVESYPKLEVTKEKEPTGTPTSTPTPTTISKVTTTPVPSSSTSKKITSVSSGIAKIVKTGDRSQVLLWGVACVTALVLISVLAYKRSKKNKQKGE